VPAGGIGAAEKADDGFAKPRGDVHRAAVGTHHPIAGGKPSHQLGQALRGPGQKGQVSCGLHDPGGLFVIPGMMGIGLAAGRPEQHEPGAVTGGELAGKAGETFLRPTLGGFARADVQAHHRALPPCRDRFARAPGLLFRRHQDERPRRSLHPQRQEQAENILHLMHRRRQRVGNRDVDVLDPRLACLGEADDVAGRHCAGEPQGARQKMGAGDDGVIEALAAQMPEQAHAVPIHARHGFAWRPVLGLGVVVNRVEVRVAGEHIHVVAVHQRGDEGIGKARPQGAEKRRGAHQIADVVAADDEDLGRGLHRKRAVTCCAGFSPTTLAATSRPTRKRNCCSG
jgi:hypothetical protein